MNIKKKQTNNQANKQTSKQAKQTNAHVEDRQSKQGQSRVQSLTFVIGKPRVTNNNNNNNNSGHRTPTQFQKKKKYKTTASPYLGEGHKLVGARRGVVQDARKLFEVKLVDQASGCIPPLGLRFRLSQETVNHLFSIFMCFEGRNCSRGDSL